MWSHFSAIYGDGNTASVGKKIGGKVQQNIETGLSHTDAGFKNACAIRMSYSLNYSGVQVGTGEWATVSGADKKLYIYRVKDLLKYLQTNFGEADKTVNSPKPIDFEGMKGILVFNVSGWSNASGHATLWDGRTCSDHCHFPISREASIWLLK
jgi:hypothetical protein